MPFNGSGTFNRLYSWVVDAAGSINISSSRTDAEMNGFAAALTNCVTRDGQSPPSADLPMGGKKLTNLGAATVGSDALNRDTADARYLTAAGGVANALTINNAGSGVASGGTFNGSAAITISYNSIGAPKADGTGASGTWGISISGAAATATSATSATSAGQVTNAVTFNTSGGAAAGTTFNGSAAKTIDYSTIGASPARPAFPGNISASYSAADADNNTHAVVSGAAQTLTLGSITAGTAFTRRFTTAWSIACAGGLSKNGAAPGGVTTGSVAANSLITFFTEGSGVWNASGSGLS